LLGFVGPVLLGAVLLFSFLFFLRALGDESLRSARHKGLLAVRVAHLGSSTRCGGCCFSFHLLSRCTHDLADRYNCQT
jgi:hypothetical protein